MNKNFLYFQLIEILKFKYELLSEELATKIGRESIIINNEKFIIYIKKDSVIIYIDVTKNINTQDIREKLNIIFNRKIVIKKIFNNYVVPEGFFYTNKGMSVKRIKKEKIDGEYITIETIENISNKWIFVTSNVYSTEFDLYQHEVKTIDPLTKEEIIKCCNKDILCRYGACINFLASSLNVNTEEGKKSDYTKFFFEFIKENDKNLETKRTVPTLGWNDNLTEFAPYSKTLHLDYSNDKYNFFKNVVKAFEPKTNSLKEFKDRLLYHAKNPFADFAISCSFAAPLLKVVGVRSFLLNYYGPSKHQKSLSIRIGISIFGKYENLEMSGADTLNVIRSKIHKLQNLPCYVDEIVQKGQKFYQVINGYDFGNEKDRHRLDRDSEIKEAKKWRTIGICSSESSIHRENDMAGEINRSLCLNVDCRPIELIDNEIKCHEYATDYYRFLENNFALIGKRYIEEIIKLKNVLVGWYKQINKKLYESNNDKNLTDHISSISITCLGNYIYRKLLFGIDDIHYSINLGIKILNHLESKEELCSEQQYLNAIYEFYEINKSNFKVHGVQKSSYNSSNQLYGAVYPEKNEIIFILGPLRDYLIKNGFDWNYKSTLVTNGFIEYKTKKINNISGKRIIIPLNKIISEAEYIKEEEIMKQEIIS